MYHPSYCVDCVQVSLNANLTKAPQPPETTAGFPPPPTVFTRFWVSKEIRKPKILRKSACVSLSPSIYIPKQLFARKVPKEPQRISAVEAFIIIIILRKGSEDEKFSRNPDFMDDRET